MKTTTSAVRRCLGGVFAASVVGGAVVAAMATPSAPSATAAADPCAASEVARTIGSVATSTAIYLDAHPETNAALTTISQQQSGPQSLGALKTYFDANPQAAKDMQALQAPLQSLSARCRLPFTLPQVMGLLQGAQSPAGSAPGVCQARCRPRRTPGPPGSPCLPSHRPPPPSRRGPVRSQAP